MQSTSKAPLPRVAIFGQLLQGSAGGIETNLLKLLAALAVENGQEDRQVVIGPGGESTWIRRYLGNGQDVLEWPPLRCEMPISFRDNAPRLISRTAKDALRKLLRRGTQPAFSSSASQLTRRLKNAGLELVHFPYQRYFPTDLPFIFEPWDLQHIHLPELFAKEEIAFRDWLYRKACNEAALVVTATRWTKLDLVEQFNLPPSKIAVVPRGAEIEPISFAEGVIEATVSRLRLPQRFALYPAKTWAHKNHTRLFNALAYLKDNEKLVIPLVCTGKPIATSEQGIRKEIASLRLDDQVFFTGFLDEDSMRHLFARAELMVFPSLFEGLGIPVLEAMALGTPVASSSASCLPEIGGEAAVFFDPYSIEDMAAQIAKVWKDSTLRADMRRRGYNNIQLYGWPAAASSFRVLYKHVAMKHLTAEEAQHVATLLS